MDEQPASVRFDERSTRRARLALLAIPVLAGCGVGGWMTWIRSPTATGQGGEPVQPIPFDHRHHVVVASREAHAGMPSVERCMGCHAQVHSDAEVLAPLRRALEEGRSIPWRRVNEVPDHVHFHHGVHVAAGVDCVQCHGAVETMAAVRQEHDLTMGWCLDCHRDPHAKDLAIDPGAQHCSACHW